jgi:FKBP-type peptidyl-prolyl cis-trans isomerase FkpA
MRKIQFLTLLIVSISVISCGKKKAREKAEENDAQIVQYLSDNGISATKTDSGLYYVIDSTTNGQYPVSTDNVTVAYKGYYIDGTVFDESSSTGINFSLQSVISGWTEGIPYFPEGAKGKLFVPAHLGYGLKDYNDIPGGSVLIFDIHLIEF